MKKPTHTSRTRVVDNGDDDDEILSGDGNGGGDGDKDDDETPDAPVVPAEPAEPAEPSPSQAEADQIKTDLAGEHAVPEATDETKSAPEETSTEPVPTQADLDAIRAGTYETR